MRVKVFTSYAYKDALLVDDLKKHLQALQRENLIELWDDLEIAPSGEWNGLVEKHMSEAEIILLAVSPDFLASDFCYGGEMKKALEQHQRGEAQIIPVILRPVHWQDAPFATIQALPKNTLPVTMWPNRDAALSLIAKNIREIVEHFLSGKEADEPQLPDTSLYPSLDLDRDRLMTDTKRELIEQLRQGCEIWNRWRELQSFDLRPDLIYANLQGIDLSGANLHSTYLLRANLRKAGLYGANLSGADLREADLNGADLSYADLSNTDLRNANLSETNLDSTDLSYADLRGANLSRAFIRSAHLRDADLSGGKLHHTVFAELDFRSAKGLAGMRHRGSSQVELHTVQLPQDGSALHFLRGAGVPDEWIDFYRAQMIHTVQYYSCFISYSSKDEVLARRLHADLQDQGVRCWFAPMNMKVGDKIRHRIDQAIHLQDKILLLLSEHALQSDWVEHEIEAALEKEQREQREVLFPVRLDESVMQTTKAGAAKLRSTRHIGDFTNWTDPQVYLQAFERLLRDLKKADK